MDSLDRIVRLSHKMRKQYPPEIAQEKFNKFLGHYIIPGILNKVELCLIKNTDNQTPLGKIFQETLRPHIEVVDAIPDNHSPLNIAGMNIGSFHSETITEETIKKYVDSIMLILADFQLADDKITEQLAYYDAMTGIPNRLSLISNSRQLIHSDDIWDIYPDPFSVILFDVDFFKKINEKYGHDGWDEALRFIASRLSDFIWKIESEKSSKTPFFGRLWGEEFLIILPWVNSDEAKKIANDLVSWISEEELSILEPSTRTIVPQKIHISAWISSYNSSNPIRKEDLELFAESQKSWWNKFPPIIGYMIKLADEAWQRAKENGRNQAIHNEDQVTISDDTLAWQRLKTELDKALRWISDPNEILKILKDFSEKKHS